MTAITIDRTVPESTDCFALPCGPTPSSPALPVGRPPARRLARRDIGHDDSIRVLHGRFFIAYGLVVFGLAALPSVRRAGMGVIIANVLYTVAAVVFVLADVFPLTATGVVLTLASGVYTLAFAELQYQGWRRVKA